MHELKEGIPGRVRSMRALGPLSRSRLMNLARAVELELHEKRPNTSTRFSGGCSVFGSSFQSRNGQQNSSTGKGSHNDWVVVNSSKEGGETKGSD